VKQYFLEQTAFAFSYPFTFSTPVSTGPSIYIIYVFYNLSISPQIQISQIYHNRNGNNNVLLQDEKRQQTSTMHFLTTIIALTSFTTIVVATTQPGNPGNYCGKCVLEEGGQTRELRV
jgi:hypothetical protein